MARIHHCLYGPPNFRENNFIPLNREYCPTSICWHGREDGNWRHMSHIPYTTNNEPTTRDLAALGNTLSDRTQWLIEMVGKTSLVQAEIANEASLKLDLIENFLDEISK